jgi:putative Mg2+ transporter-C (MgtC) family protein
MNAVNLADLVSAQSLREMGEVLLALLLGAAIGWEREWRHRPAGLRTHMLVCAGATCFAIASGYGYVGLGTARDPARIAAQIVSGVGFLGAGTIWKTADTIRGLTTAASIWLVAAIGLLIGAGMEPLAVFTTVAGLLALWLLRPVKGMIEPGSEPRDESEA